MEVAAAPAEAENIAVCIRVRPLNERERRAQDAPALSCVPSLSVVALTDPATGAPLAGKGNVFQYDEIFDDRSDARAIYARVGRRIVRSTLGGINGTIFAYGQTSSGKTFTMQGEDGALPFEAPSQAGVLQLAVEDIFQYIESCADRDFLLRVSFLEIYNEVVKDLLNPTDSLKLREDPRKGVYVECREEIITNCDDIVALLQAGNANRTVGHTAMNDKSSRSHSVFRIVIESKHKADSRRLSEEDVNGTVLVASLNLVDLAGSESLRHTGAEGIRQREAGNINKSLLTLARVINSLASSGGRGQNAPFRDSKLTRLLQNSLGGNTRTLIICCVTPSDRYIEETKSTLQFAARAKDIQTSATVNEVLDDQTQLRRLKREVHELKKLVNSEALNALKAENEALLSEKSHNKTEMARLMGLILSSTSVTKAAEGTTRKQRGKRMRETWGPGDFPAKTKALAPLSPNLYPRKRRSPAKENMDPQTLFRVYEDIDDTAVKEYENPAIDNFKPNQVNQDAKENSKQVLDLFSAVFRSYRDGNCEDPIAAMEKIANEKSASLGDIERARAFDVLADIRSLMVANVQSRSAWDEKQVLEQEVTDLRSKLNASEPASCDCSGNASKAGTLVQEIMAELTSTQETLAQETRRSHDLEIEKANSQQMAAQELDSLRSQLETLKLESDEARDRFDSEKRQFEAALETLKAGSPRSEDEEKMSLRSRKDELDSLLEEMKASQTVLQLAVAERDEEIALLKSLRTGTNQAELETRVKSLEEENAVWQQRISELEAMEQKATPTSEVSSAESDIEISQDASEQTENAVAEKLAGELQGIMQELVQLQSDHERAALEKVELQAQTERLGEELEVSQRQGYEISETLMEKEHIAKVLQAQLDAKLMTISQMQTKHSGELEELQKSIQDLTAEKELLLAKIQELDAPTTDGEPTQSNSIECIAANNNAEENSREKQDVEMEAQNLRAEVEQLNEKLSCVELELAETKKCLQAALTSFEDPPDQSEIKTVSDKLKTNFDNLQKAVVSDASLEKQEQGAEVPSPDDQNSSSRETSLQERYDTLNEEFKRITDELEQVSSERNDCVEELRALESQLMEMSEEKMKLVIAAEAQETQLREVHQTASYSSETIALLEARLAEAQSAKAVLEAGKAELAQNIDLVQNALTDLQADHAVIVEQTQHRKTAFDPESENGIAEVEQIQQRLEIESKQREKLQLDVQSYEETLSVLREEAKDSSATTADLLEKMKILETDLDSASRSQKLKDKEMKTLTDALARSKEEQQEMRLQSKQRLVAVEGKEMALEEKISALEQQVQIPSTGMSMMSMPIPTDTQAELIASREKQVEFQAKVTTLENQLIEAQEELHKQDADWNKKQAMAEREFARLATEQKQLREQLSALQRDVEASEHEMKVKAEELVKAQQSCAELAEQKEAIQHELETANATWDEKQQDLMQQMESIREQFQEAQEDLEGYQKNADGEIHRLRSVIELTNAENEELKRSAKAREEELENQIVAQEDWQNQVKCRQEALQSKCDELDDERRQLKEKCADLNAQRGDVDEQLQQEINKLSEKYAAAQAQQATYQGKLKEMEVQLEMTENEVTQNRSELKTLAESLKSSQVEAVQYHNELVEAQLAKESMEKLVEKQMARINKLEKVKMTTDTLDLFRKLKKDRHDLQVKVKDLENNLVQAEHALTQTQEHHQDKEYRLVEHNDKELKLLKERVEELHEALRAEKHQAADVKTEMRSALEDEREKAEHEIQEMQALVKEKMELVEKLESQLGSVEDAIAKLREQKSEKVSYLEKENLDLHVENRELKKRLETASSVPDNDELMGDTGTYDASAAAAAKILGEDNANESEVNVIVSNADAEATSQPQEVGATKARGFLLSKSELDAIAADSQDDPKCGERPECTQQ